MFPIICVCVHCALYSAGIFKQAMVATNRVGIGFVIPARQATKAGGIDSLELILVLLKSLKIRALGAAAVRPGLCLPALSSLGTKIIKPVLYSAFYHSMSA
jgi:hypothetical protein